MYIYVYIYRTQLHSDLCTHRDGILSVKKSSLSSMLGSGLTRYIGPTYAGTCACEKRDHKVSI